MKTDPIPFIAAALSGIASRGVHDMAGPLDQKTGTPVVIPGVKPEHIASRAVELGVATAAAYDAVLAQLEDAPPAPKAKR